MRPGEHLWLWMGLFCLLLSPLPAHAAEDVSPETLARIERYVAEELEQVELPGAALGIVSGDELILARGFGVADKGTGEPVTPWTLFQIGSITKSFTAVAILQLRDRGLLELDAPVQRYVPWFRLADEESSRRITVRHLLMHTSGIPATAEFDVFWGDPEAIRPSLERAVRELRTVEPAFEPGARFEYANMGYGVLGVVVEAVSGEPYAQYIERHILEPLGMEDSTFSLEEARRRPHASLHERFFLWLREVPYGSYNAEPWAAPAGMLLSSVEDMARYAGAQLGTSEVQLLSPSTLEEAHTQGFFAPSAQGDYVPGAFVRWYGFGEMWLQHGGGTRGASANLLLLPERGQAVILLGGGKSLRISGIARGVAAILMGQPPPPVEGDVLELLGGLLLGLAILGVLLFVGALIALLRARAHGWGEALGWGRWVKAGVLVLLAGASLSLLWLAPVLFPPLRTLWGFHAMGWDAVVAIGLLSLGTVAWAVWGVLRAWHGGRRRQERRSRAVAGAPHAVGELA